MGPTAPLISVGPAAPLISMGPAAPLISMGPAAPLISALVSDELCPPDVCSAVRSIVDARVGASPILNKISERADGERPVVDPGKASERSL